MAEWFLAKDKLPEDDRDVLVYDEDCGFRIAWLERNPKRWYCDEIGKLFGVTHWMPLPQLPKGE